MEYIESLKYFKNRKTGRKMIPYGRQTIEEDDIQAVVDVLRSTSANTGVPPQYSTQFDEAANVNGVVITSSPG